MHVWCKKNLPFLAQTMDKTGIYLLPEKIDVIKIFLQPESVRQLRRFIRMINYYRWLLLHRSSKLITLTLKNTQLKNAQILLHVPALCAFHEIKKAIAIFVKLIYLW